jgi:hypothetical protein
MLPLMPLELLRAREMGPIFVQGYGATEDGPNVTILSRQQHRVLNKPPEEQKILASAGLPTSGFVRSWMIKTMMSGLEGGEIVVKSRL